MKIAVDFDGVLIRSQEIIIDLFKSPGVPEAFDTAVIYWLSNKIRTEENDKYEMHKSFITLLDYLAANNFEKYDMYLTQEKLANIYPGFDGMEKTMQQMALFIHGGEVDVFDRLILLIASVASLWHKENHPITQETVHPTEFYLNKIARPAHIESGFKDKFKHFINKKKYPLNYSIVTNPLTMAFLALVTPNKHPMDIVDELRMREFKLNNINPEDLIE